MKAALLLTFLGTLLFAGAPPETQRARIERLESKLLAPCCWQETVKVHRSEIALQMQGEIAQMVASGRTDRQILDLYIQRYGKRILVEPEGSAWWLALVVPLLAAMFGLWFVLRFVRRMRAPVPAPAADAPVAPIELDDDF
jgi:cytochrome c-type biogenesis protein CcmH